jgi:hypothetical protein
LREEPFLPLLRRAATRNAEESQFDPVTFDNTSFSTSQR